jgi:hypothetical protein
VKPGPGASRFIEGDGVGVACGLREPGFVEAQRFGVGDPFQDLNSDPVALAGRCSSDHGDDLFEGGALSRGDKLQSEDAARGRGGLEHLNKEALGAYVEGVGDDLGLGLAGHPQR